MRWESEWKGDQVMPEKREGRIEILNACRETGQGSSRRRVSRGKFAEIDADDSEARRRTCRRGTDRGVHRKLEGAPKEVQGGPAGERGLDNVQKAQKGGRSRGVYEPGLDLSLVRGPSAPGSRSILTKRLAARFVLSSEASHKCKITRRSVSVCKKPSPSL